MTGRRALFAAALALLAAPAEAQQAAAPPPRRPPPRRRAAPATPAPAPVETRRGEPAPVPNLDIEGPRRQEVSRTSPQFNPTLIDPAEPRFGTAPDRNNIQTREDRLLRQPAPGARLSLPFAY